MGDGGREEINKRQLYSVYHPKLVLYDCDCTSTVDIFFLLFEMTVTMKNSLMIYSMCGCAWNKKSFSKLNAIINN